MNQNTDVSLLVLSCDSYEDILEPFFILKERYWPDCKYPVYVATETKDVPYPATSLKFNYPVDQWSMRIRMSLERIPTEYVLVMDSDMFIRKPVDQSRIDYCLANFDQDTAAFSFELEFAPTWATRLTGFRRKPVNTRYLCSCQPTLWRRTALINLLTDEHGRTPWEWETHIPQTSYNFYVNSGAEIIDIGYHPTRWTKRWYGVRKGRWMRADVVPLFEKEGIIIDFSQRGFYEEHTSLFTLEIPG